GFGMLFKFL
uniref:Short cationic peptide-4e n=1 Tax=Cupiennius salei TaxID=6928 RepID=TXS4E_CUPSA|nr:RecName: Full=Short cationic peptide-4e; Short=SCP-4e; AltName: Full=Cupiennin 1-like peptide-1g; AltName: Full=Short cationic peptide-1g; Short=SCP-1g; AltName: Full=Truncated variant of Cupiennin 4 family [Cupiennius salei]